MPDIYIPDSFIRTDSLFIVMHWQRSLSREKEKEKYRLMVLFAILVLSLGLIETYSLFCSCLSKRE